MYTDEDPSDTVSVSFKSVSAIQKTLSKYFEKNHTMSLENYQISNQEMIDHIGSEVETTDCKYSRKQ